MLSTIGSVASQGGVPDVININTDYTFAQGFTVNESWCSNNTTVKLVSYSPKTGIAVIKLVSLTTSTIQSNIYLRAIFYVRNEVGVNTVAYDFSQLNSYQILNQTFSINIGTMRSGLLTTQGVFRWGFNASAYEYVTDTVNSTAWNIPVY